MSSSMTSSPSRTRCLRPAATLPAIVVLAAGTLAAPQNPIERASVASDGSQADGGSYYATLSSDGRYVAFSSDATNLVTGDTNGVDDVFRRDRLTGTTIRVSVSSTGAEGDDESYTSYLDAISDDGRYVAFTSDAGNLVPGDTNGGDDVFVRDVRLGTTVRVSVGPAGIEANGESYDASISDDGARVVFTSGATNLVDPPTDGNNPQVYVHDLSTGTTHIASVSSSGEVADGAAHYPAISGDGSTVAFVSTAHNLAAGLNPATIPNVLYVHDLASGITTLETLSPSLANGSRFAGYQSLSRDGRHVAFWSDAPDLVPGDANGEGDAFLLDRATDDVRLVSRSSTGTQGNALIAFPRMSADGRFVAFTSDLGILVPGDTNGRFDAFVHDRVTSATNRVSVGADGEQGAGSSFATAFPSGLSADGRFVAFHSDFRNLISADSNGVGDVFVVDRASPIPASYCEATLDSQGCEPAIASSGTPSTSGSAPFLVSAEPVRAGRLGLLLYGLGPNREPFGAGLLCVAPPLRRTAPISSGGTAGCTGSLSIDFNEQIRSGVDPSLVAGTVAYAQFVYRDGPELGASDALRFTIQP